ncbi:hypothetical protein LXL04_033815 [Taraxacum kok-saghyz]
MVRFYMILVTRNTSRMQFNDICNWWVSLVPIKVNVFAWKMMCDALPTRWNLSQQGLELNSMLCPICGEKVEDMEHLFFTCSFASEITDKVVRWWGLSSYSFPSLQGWKGWLDGMQLRKKLKEVLEGVFFIEVFSDTTKSQSDKISDTEERMLICVKKFVPEMMTKMEHDPAKGSAPWTPPEAATPEPPQYAVFRTNSNKCALRNIRTCSIVHHDAFGHIS